jgi:hypothetical protein
MLTSCVLKLEVFLALLPQPNILSLPVNADMSGTTQPGSTFVTLNQQNGELLKNSLPTTLWLKYCPRPPQLNILWSSGGLSDGTWLMDGLLIANPEDKESFQYGLLEAEQFSVAITKKQMNLPNASLPQDSMRHDVGNPLSPNSILPIPPCTTLSSHSAAMLMEKHFQAGCSLSPNLQLNNCLEATSQETDTTTNVGKPGEPPQPVNRWHSVLLYWPNAPSEWSQVSASLHGQLSMSLKGGVSPNEIPMLLPCLNVIVQPLLKKVMDGNVSLILNHMEWEPSTTLLSKTMSPTWQTEQLFTTVSRGPQPDPAKELPTPGTSGLTHVGLSAKYGPHTCFSKTCPACLLPKEFLAYVAGLIDGEGSITLQRSKHNGGEHYAAEVRIGMSQKALPMLRMLQESVGGTLTHFRKATKKWDSAWTWRIGGVAAASLLWHIFPFLCVKGSQAMLVIRGHELLRETPRHRNGTTQWTSTLLEAFQRLKMRMLELNRKGPPILPPGAFAMLVDGEWCTGQLQLDGTLERFSGTWPKSGICRHGVCWERTTLGPIIAANASGYWLPTPQAHQGGYNQGGGNGREGQPMRPSLSMMASRDMWPTPNVPTGGRTLWHAEQEGNCFYHNGKKVQLGLEQAVRMWPTPQAHDSTPGNAERVGRFGTTHGGRNLNDEVAMWPTPTVQGGTGYMSGANRDTWRPTLEGAVQMAPEGPPPLITAEDYRGKGRKAAWATPLSRDAPSIAGNVPPPGHQGGENLGQQVGGTLNPQWVEWLMGWPIHWCTPGPLNPQMFHEWQQAFRSVLANYGH